jgi:branched-subunit amino acid ABC-type transport system permease component
VLGSLYLLYDGTAVGLRLRATAIDPYKAGQVGVNCNLASLLSWSLGGAIAGLSAILISPIGSFGPDLVVRGLAAALVAGMGNMGAAFATGVLIGLFEAVATYINRTPGLVDFGLAAFIVLLLLVKPNGLWPGRYGTV